MKYVLFMAFSMLTPDGVQQDGYRTIEGGLAYTACQAKAQNNALAAGPGMVATLNCKPEVAQ